MAASAYVPLTLVAVLLAFSATQATGNPDFTTCINIGCTCPTCADFGGSPQAQCDFYFQGYGSSIPTFDLGSGQGDYIISTAIVNAKDGQVIQVINTNEGYEFAPYVSNDNQNQFYGGDNSVHVRTFNNPQNVNDYRGKCFKLKLSSVELANGSNPLNLNPYDGNNEYPQARRCVVFKTA